MEGWYCSHCVKSWIWKIPTRTKTSGEKQHKTYFLGVLGVDDSEGEALEHREEDPDDACDSSFGSGVTLGSWLYSLSEETSAKGLTQVSEFPYGNLFCRTDSSKEGKYLVLFTCPL